MSYNLFFGKIGRKKLVYELVLINISCRKDEKLKLFTFKSRDFELFFFSLVKTLLPWSKDLLLNMVGKTRSLYFQIVKFQIQNSLHSLIHFNLNTSYISQSL